MTKVWWTTFPWFQNSISVQLSPTNWTCSKRTRSTTRLCSISTKNIRTYVQHVPISELARIWAEQNLGRHWRKRIWHWPISFVTYLHSPRSIERICFWKKRECRSKTCLNTSHRPWLPLCPQSAITFPMNRLWTTMTRSSNKCRLNFSRKSMSWSECSPICKTNCNRRIARSKSWRRNEWILLRCRIWWTRTSTLSSTF